MSRNNLTLFLQNKVIKLPYSSLLNFVIVKARDTEQMRMNYEAIQQLLVLLSNITIK